MDLVNQLLEIWHLAPEKGKWVYLLGQMVTLLGPWLYVILFVIIFCETGLVVTPFLPGDSLLFAVGAVCAISTLNLSLILGLLIVAAVLGDAVNYTVGWRLGPKVFRSEKSWLFNKSHLLRTQVFYEKYGGKAIILARFVPIIRTFAPFVAGIGKMPYWRFFAFNVVGGVAWVLICVFGGYFFGNIPEISDNFEWVTVAIVLISVLPIAIQFVLDRRRRARGEPEPMPAVMTEPEPVEAPQ
jgi:membrane-associated protein